MTPYQPASSSPNLGQRDSRSRFSGAAITEQSRIARSIACVYAVQLVLIVDVNVAVLAGPRIARDMNASDGELQLMFVAFAVAFATSLLPGVVLGDRLGTRAMARGGTILFALAEGLFAVAPSMGMVIGARILTGLAAGALTPQVFRWIQIDLPFEVRARAYGAFGTVGALATVVTQIGGGLLIRDDPLTFGWRTLPAVVCLLGGLVATFIWVAVGRTSHRRAAAPDALGLVLLGITVAGVILPLSVGRIRGWSPSVFAVIGSSISIGFAFHRYEWRRVERGLAAAFDPRLLLVDTYRRGLVATLAIGCTNVSGMFLITVFLQNGLGVSPLRTGGVLSCMAAGCFIGSRYSSGTGSIESVLVGQVAGMFGVLSLAIVAFLSGGDFPVLLAGPGVAAIGFGQGSVIPQLYRFTLIDVHGLQTSQAGAMLATMQQSANALGVGVIGAAFFAVLGRATRTDYASAFGVTCSVALGGLYAVGFWLLWRLRQTVLQSAAQTTDRPG
jgi:MFS family permease